MFKTVEDFSKRINDLGNQIKTCTTQIYKMVTKKKDYTLYHFKKDFVL